MYIVNSFILFILLFVGEIHAKNCISPEQAEIRLSRMEAQGNIGSYSPSRKHEQGGWGSKNPIENQNRGQELLDSSYIGKNKKQRYNFEDDKVVVFQPDGQGGWHSYVAVDVVKEKVPTSVLRQMLKEGIITKPQYNRIIKNK